MGRSQVHLLSFPQRLLGTSLPYPLTIPASPFRNATEGLADIIGVGGLGRERTLAQERARDTGGRGHWGQKTRA